ncbi:MAG: hypothetical protein IGS39_21785 [Calothrix sp. C42_A2020_038]|nr:hypothetical protein [Calothrix sp. C42_A2020_038]
MVLWEEDSIEYDIFKQYERALIALGIDFDREDVQDALLACTHGLEDALRRTIEYILWLKEHDREVFANAILVQALQNQWKPKNWQPGYFDKPDLQSIGQKWWNGAAKIWGWDIRNQLIADVCYENGKELIKFMNGKSLLVETAWRWGWERVRDYATSK